METPLTQIPPAPEKRTFEVAGMSHAAQTTAELDKILERLDQQDAKLSLLLENSMSMKKAASRSMWLTIIFVILPIVVSVAAIPFLAKTLLNSSGLTGEDAGLGSISVPSLLDDLQKAKGAQQDKIDEAAK